MQKKNIKTDNWKLVFFQKEKRLESRCWASVVVCLRFFYGDGFWKIYDVYDYFVFALQSRYPKGLTRRIQEVIQNETYFDKLLPYIPPRLQKMLVDKRLRVVSLLLFLLEELLWNIQENTNSMFTCQSGSWLLLQKEMPQALKLLGDACSQNVDRR